MDSGEFALYINRLHPLQGVQVKFGKDGMTGLFRLHALLESNRAVRLDERGKTAMEIVFMARNWCGDQNRTYLVFGLQKADPAMLAAIAKDVESIDSGYHLLKGIMSGRQKSRDEAYKQLVNGVLTKSFLTEASVWDLSISGHLSEFESIPCVEFTLRLENEHTNILVDGWSGRMAVDGKFGDEMVVSHGQIQNLLREEIEKILEKVTAV